MVLNNASFLAFSDRQKLAHLTSRVQALVLQRLGDDWLQHHVKAVQQVESFVEDSRFRSTCYRACGFNAVIATATFAWAYQDISVEHDGLKQLFVRRPHHRGRDLLRQCRIP